MWGKREDMIVRDQSPFNAEPPAAVLAEGGVTALDAFYARNHGAFSGHSGRGMAVDGCRHGG